MFAFFSSSIGLLRLACFAIIKLKTSIWSYFLSSCMSTTLRWLVCSCVHNIFFLYIFSTHSHNLMGLSSVYAFNNASCVQCLMLKHTCLLTRIILLIECCYESLRNKVILHLNLPQHEVVVPHEPLNVMSCTCHLWWSYVLTLYMQNPPKCWAKTAFHENQIQVHLCLVYKTSRMNQKKIYQSNLWAGRYLTWIGTGSKPQLESFPSNLQG